MTELKRSVARQEPKRIGLLGASLDTGNLGVSALAESCIKCIYWRWPNAKVTLLGGSWVDSEHRLKILENEIFVKQLTIRFNYSVFSPNHFCLLFFYSQILKILPWKKFRELIICNNKYLKSIMEADIVADITGGDSFTDMYGIRRFFIGFLHKWLVLLYGKKLIMLPQTYGPFKHYLSRVMVRHILKKASLVYSRDRAGVEYVNKLLNDPRDEKVRFAPDVGFVLDPREPQNAEVSRLRKLRARDTIVVGLNISGLLYNGGHTINERFGLKTDYRQLVCQVARLLLENDKVKLLLVPHVLPPAPAAVNDTVACLALYEQLGREYPGRIFLVKGEYDQGEIKYVIGLCDFFIGSRMHSCIAALSQCIPAVGIAYSKKFEGVFESIGLADCVVDMRNFEEGESLKKLESFFECRNQIREHLVNVMPKVKNDIYSIFEKSQLTKVWAEC